MPMSEPTPKYYIINSFQMPNWSKDLAKLLHASEFQLFFVAYHETMAAFGQKRTEIKARRAPLSYTTLQQLTNLSNTAIQTALKGLTQYKVFRRLSGKGPHADEYFLNVAASDAKKLKDGTRWVSLSNRLMDIPGLEVRMEKELLTNRRKTAAARAARTANVIERVAETANAQTVNAASVAASPPADAAVVGAVQADIVQHSTPRPNVEQLVSKVVHPVPQNGKKRSVKQNAFPASEHDQKRSVKQNAYRSVKQSTKRSVKQNGKNPETPSTSQETASHNDLYNDLYNDLDSTHPLYTPIDPMTGKQKKSACVDESTQLIFDFCGRKLQKDNRVRKNPPKQAYDIIFQEVLQIHHINAFQLQQLITGILADKTVDNPIGMLRWPDLNVHRYINFTAESESQKVPKIERSVESWRTKAGGWKVNGRWDVRGIWTDALKILSNRINPPSFNTWLRPTQLTSIEQQLVTIEVPDDTYVEWLGKYYREPVCETLGEFLGFEPELKFAIMPDEARR